MTERKLDIFKLLSSIDEGDIHFYESLEEEEQKQFVPLVAMRWASGTSSKRQILKLNQFLNPAVFNLYDHKPLLYNLMVVSSDGKQKSYKWIKRASKLGSKPNTTKLLASYYECSLTRAREYEKLLSLDDILHIANLLGEDKEVVDKIRKEHK